MLATSATLLSQADITMSEGPKDQKGRCPASKQVISCLRVCLLVEGRGSRVTSRGSRVNGRGSRVNGRGSRVNGRGSRVNGRGSRVNGRGSRVNGRGSKNSSQLFLSVVKSKFHIGPCLLEFPVPVLLSDRSVNQPARLLPFADE